MTNNYSSHFKQNAQLAYPVMLSQLGHVMMGVVDSIMVGHVNAVSLAAASLANIAFNILMLFGIGVSYAITPLVAEADGKRDNNMIVDIFRHGLIINFVISLLLVVGATFYKKLLYHINQPFEVVELAIPYLNIVTFSLIPMLIFQSFKQLAEGLSQTKVAMFVMIVSNIVNIILNYIFIYGHVGFSAMGLNGAGYATFLSRLFMMLCIVFYIFFAKDFKKFRPIFSFRNYTRKLFNKMLHIGLPAGLQFIFEVAAFDFSAVMMGWLGTYTLAAHQIAINLATISYMITSGLAAAATIRVGYFLGKKDKLNMTTAAHTLLLMGMGVMLFWAILFISGRNYLPTFYIENPNVISIAAPLLVVAGFFQLADGAQVICAGALRGLQDVKIPSLYIFAAYWLVGLPLGYLLAFKLDYGAVGIWIGLLIGLVSTAIALFFRFTVMARRMAA
jgi:multidrug resistance protein, MATE family